MIIRRRPDWNSRLRDYLRDLQTNPREICAGRHDCCLFAAGAVDAQTGVDLAADWRGRYTTFKGGLRLIRAAGHADIAALLAADLTEAAPHEAMPGDIAIVASPEGPALGVVQGSAVYVLHSTGRINGVPATAIQRLFKLEDC